MGVHTGEATPAGDHYVGLAVHRAARICDAGHGGQVLISETTRSLLEDEEHELDGLAVHDLGHHVLKDFDRPVRIYQLAIEGLQAEFPPLRTDTGEAAALAERQDELVAEEPTPGEAAVRVLIVDDQVLVRTGFRMILEAEPDLEVVGEASDGLGAIAQARSLAPDVVLMDVRMPEMDGIEVTRRIKHAHPEVVVVLISIEERANLPADALSSGAAALVRKQDFGPRLLRQLWLAHAPRN
jgi:CheY-like chemotaxis protein